MRELSLAIAIVIAGAMIAISGRYSVGATDQEAYVVDNFTGAIWRCFGSCERVGTQ